MYALLPVVLAVCQLAVAQNSAPIPNTWPNAWPGQPSGDYSPAWQSYFEVTETLPNITGVLDVPRSYAGSISVNRADHPNDTLFFWGFEKSGSNGSLADVNNSDPWIIWLQGGPGSSGMIGLFTENGPIHVLSNYTLVLNNYSWNHLADAFWIDQPVGTGWSTADSKGYIADEDQMGEDFLGFLTNLVKVFPGLATRPLYLAGESYAGTYIPYILKHLFGTPTPPVKVAGIAIGDGSLDDLATIRDLPVLNVIETYPQIINYDPEVYEYFKTQHHLCGYDINLTYPQQGGFFPTLNTFKEVSTDERLKLTSGARSTTTSWKQSIAEKYYEQLNAGNAGKRSPIHERREEKRQVWKRSLAGRANGTIDPFYGCDVFDEMTDYAVNFSFPWTNGAFDVYDIPDGTNPEPPLDASVFLNNNQTRAALYAPTSKDWIRNFNYPFGSVHNLSIGNEHGDPSVSPMPFLSELHANASINNISFVFFSGNDDSLIQHHGTEVIIQNMTFGGIQGFTRKPSTPWFDDDGEFAGIIHQERNLTYILINGAGHLASQWKPAQVLVMVREFVLGRNETGLVINNSTIGGENSTLANDVLPGGTLFYYGSATTSGTSTVPAATVSSWNNFIRTATLTGSAATAGSSQTSNAAVGQAVGLMRILVVAGVSMWYLF